MKNEIRKIINEILDNTSEIEDEERLVLFGLDSMGAIKLVVMLEEAFGIKIDDDDLLVENFENITSINNLVNECIDKQKASAKFKDYVDAERKKVAIVTGANRGIGYGIARKLFDEGYRVVALNRTLINEEWIEEIKCDIKNRTDISKAMDYIANKYSYIDILVNNAGIREFGRIDMLTEEQWDDSLETNLTAPFCLIRSALKCLVRAKGLVVFIGSSAAEYTFEGGIAYSCTKAALQAMAETVIKDLRYEDVRVSHISLGATEISDTLVKEELWKIQPADVGLLITSISKLPQRILPAYIDLRPAKPRRSTTLGLDRLQYL